MPRTFSIYYTNTFMETYATYSQSKRWPVLIRFGMEERLLSIEQAKIISDTLIEILDNLLMDKPQQSKDSLKAEHKGAPHIPYMK